MKKYRLDEFFSDPEFEGIITNRDRKYYNDNGTFKDRGKILEVLSNQYFDVSFEGRGKKLLLTIGDKNPDAPPLDGRVNNNFSDVDNQILKNFSAHLKEEIFDGRIQEGHSRTIMKWLFNSQVLGELPHIYNTYKSVETGEFKEASKLIEQYYTDNLKVEVDTWMKEYYANRRVDHNEYERPKIKDIILNPITQKFLISEYTMFISATFKKKACSMNKFTSESLFNSSKSTNTLSATNFFATGSNISLALSKWLIAAVPLSSL